jgi:hypothetical protein
VLKIAPGNILFAFDNLVLGLSLAHTYLNFSIPKLAYQSRAEKDATFPGIPSQFVGHGAPTDIKKPAYRVTVLIKRAQDVSSKKTKQVAALKVEIH